MSRGVDGSEPAMSVLVASEQYKDFYGFVVPDADARTDFNSYIQVVITFDALGSLQLDGEVLSGLPLSVVSGSSPTTVTGKSRTCSSVS